jgi:hypothetical protein
MMLLVERRYRFLRLITLLLRLAALIIFVLAIVLGVLMFTGIETIRIPPDMLVSVRALGTLPLLPTLVIGILLPLQLLTLAELIRVALDIEENTRSTAASHQTLVTELHTLIQNIPDVSMLEQNTRFVADDTHRVAQLLEAMAEEQRTIAGTLHLIERKLPPTD